MKLITPVFCIVAFVAKVRAGHHHDDEEWCDSMARACDRCHDKCHPHMIRRALTQITPIVSNYTQCIDQLHICLESI